MTNIEIFQNNYNNLIGLANAAYKNHHTQKNWPTSSEWLGKALAYEYSAALLDSSCLAAGITIKSTSTERETDNMKALAEERTYDLEEA